MFEYSQLVPGRKVRRLTVCERKEAERLPRVAQVAVQIRAEDPLVGEVVGQPRRLLQKLSNRNVRAAAHLAREHSVDVVVEPQLAFGGKLEDDRRNERLRHAADPKAVPGPRANVTGDDRSAARQANGAIAVTHEQHGARHARCDEAVELLLERRALGRSCDRRAGGDATQDHAA